MQVTFQIEPEALRLAVRDEVASFIRNTLRNEIAEAVAESVSRYIRKNGEDIAIAVFDSAAWDDAKEAAIDGDDIAEKVIYKLSGKSLTITID